MKKRNEKKEDINEQNPYEVDKLSKVPSGLILTFSKFWAAAAAVFFILVGGRDLGLDFSNSSGDLVEEFSKTLGSMVLVALFLALLLNYGVKHLAHLMLNRRNNTKKWMVINLKGFAGFLVYMVYSVICVVILFIIIAFLSSKHLIPSILDNNGSGIEPFSFGLIFALIDGIFLLIKNYIIKLFQVIRYKKLINA